jgi:hypothetical protein
MGILLNGVERSLAYAGRYLHLSLDEEANVVVANCHLSSQLGARGAPMYTSWRKTRTGTRRAFFGTYLSNGHQLFLLGSQKNDVDLRMSIFQIDQDQDERTLKGHSVGVSYARSVLSTRCYLVPTNCVRPRTKMPNGLQPKALLEKWLPDAAKFLFEPGGVSYLEDPKREV